MTVQKTNKQLHILNIKIKILKLFFIKTYIK